MNGLNNQYPPTFIVNPMTGLLNQIPQTFTINMPQAGNSTNPGLPQGQPQSQVSPQGQPQSQGEVPNQEGITEGIVKSGTGLDSNGKPLKIKKPINKKLVIIISVIVGILLLLGIIGIIVLIIRSRNNTT